jgi:hypothetical protein
VYSKKEKAQLITDFWTAFAEAYPHKWLLYDTKIKDLQLKFDVQNSGIRIVLEVGMRQEEIRMRYFDQLKAMRVLFLEFFPEIFFERNFTLESGKVVSMVYTEKLERNFFNKNVWPEIFEFMASNMMLMEQFFLEYADIIRQAKVE